MRYHNNDKAVRDVGVIIDTFTKHGRKLFIPATFYVPARNPAVLGR